jgi:pyrroloquinoline quinone biosynthesis protein E
MLTGDATNTDPVCSLSPHHGELLASIERIMEADRQGTVKPMVFRNPRNSRALAGSEPVTTE